MRTPIDIVAAAANYALKCYQGERAAFQAARIIERNTHRPLEDLLAEQDRAIERMVNHAYACSPYYRRKYDEAGFKPGDVKTRADLEKLPSIYKTEMVEYMDEILTVPRSELWSSESGGTTGVRLLHYRRIETARYRRGIDLFIPRYYGWRDGQWRAWLWAATQDIYEPSGWKALLIRHLAERQFFFNASRIEADNIQGFLNLVRKRKPTYASSYPSLAYAVAEFIEAGLVSPARVPVVSLTAEPTYDFQRDKIREFFADEVYERYGMRECGIFAIECPEHNGLHLFTESVYLETEQRQEEPGQHLLVTDLHNYAMPLIRYETGDFGEVSYTSCPCGWETPRVTEIQGRETDTIVRPDGPPMLGLLPVAMIGHVDIRAKLQIVQEATDRIVLLVEGSVEDNRPEIERLFAIFREEISDKIQYEAIEVDRIERPPSGKYRYVISKVNQPGKTAGRPPKERGN